MIQKVTRQSGKKRERANEQRQKIAAVSCRCIGPLYRIGVLFPYCGMKTTVQARRQGRRRWTQDAHEETASQTVPTGPRNRQENFFSPLAGLQVTTRFCTANPKRAAEPGWGWEERRNSQRYGRLQGVAHSLGWPFHPVS